MGLSKPLLNGQKRRKSRHSDAVEAVRALMESFYAPDGGKPCRAVGSYTPSMAQMSLKLTSCQFPRLSLFSSGCITKLSITHISASEESLKCLESSEAVPVRM